MPKAARKSKPARVPDHDVDIDVGDVTAAVYPEGVPQDPDGQVATGGSIPVAQARKIGAVTSDAAAANKHVARQVDRANKGESVSWNTDDPLAIFDGIRTAFPSTAIRIFIKDVDSQEQYAQPAMGQFRDSSEFYNYLLKNVHRNKRTAKYEIMFKQAGNSAIRGKGFLMMPDTVGETPAAAPAAPQPVWNPQTQQWYYPPPPQMQPPQMMQGPFGYPSVFAPQPPSQPVQQPQVPQNVHIHNVTPPVPPAPQGQPQSMSPQYAPPPAQAPAPPMVDPMVMQMLQANSEQTNQLRMMLAEVIGANRAQAQQPTSQPASQHVAPPAPPPGYVLQPVPGYIPPGYEPPPGYTLQPIAPPQQYAPPQPQGVGAPPPAPVHAAVPPAPPPLVPSVPGADNPFGFNVGGVLKAMKSIEDMRKVLGANAAPAEVEAPEPAEFVPPAVPEVTSVPLGQGPDAMVYVHNKDGSPNVMGMILGNLHKVPKFLTDVAQGVGKMNEVVEDAARRAPIQANVYSPPQGGPVVEARRLVQVAPPPAPAPVQNVQQHASLIPNVPRA